MKDLIQKNISMRKKRYLQCRRRGPRSLSNKSVLKFQYDFRYIHDRFTNLFLGENGCIIDSRCLIAMQWIHLRISCCEYMPGCLLCYRGQNAFSRFPRLSGVRCFHFLTHPDRTEINSMRHVNVGRLLTPSHASTSTSRQRAFLNAKLLHTSRTIRQEASSPAETATSKTPVIKEHKGRLDVQWPSGSTSRL